MSAPQAPHLSAQQLLERMFDVELRFLRSDTADADLLATAFHPDVTIHEPATLPYAGDWTGLAGVGALLGQMREVWSDVSIEGLSAARQDDTVYMACTLSLTSRSSGATIRQPFAEVLRFQDNRLIEGTPFYFDTGAIAAALGAAAG